MLLLKTCTCGCAMHIYKHGSGPYVNLTPDTANILNMELRETMLKTVCFLIQN